MPCSRSRRRPRPRPGAASARAASQRLGEPPLPVRTGMPTTTDVTEVGYRRSCRACASSSSSSPRISTESSGTSCRSSWNAVTRSASSSRSKPNLPPGGGALLDSLAERYASFSYGYEPPREDEWLSARTACRHGLDYLRYLERPLTEATNLRAPARERAPEAVLRGDRLVIGSPRARRLVLRCYAGSMASFRSTARSGHQVAAAEADSRSTPARGLCSKRATRVYLDRELGLPSVLPVASWDNLTNKLLLKDVPDADSRLERGPGRGGRRPPRRPARARPRERGPRLRPLVRPRLRPLARGLPRTRSASPDGALHRLRRDPPRAERSRDSVACEWTPKHLPELAPAVRELGVLVPTTPAERGGAGLPSSFPDERVAVWPRTGASPTDEAKRRGLLRHAQPRGGLFGINTSGSSRRAYFGDPAFILLTWRPGQARGKRSRSPTSLAPRGRRHRPLLRRAPRPARRGACGAARSHASGSSARRRASSGRRTRDPVEPLAGAAVEEAATRGRSRPSSDWPRGSCAAASRASPRTGRGRRRRLRERSARRREDALVTERAARIRAVGFDYGAGRASR